MVGKADYRTGAAKREPTTPARVYMENQSCPAAWVTAEPVEPARVRAGASIPIPCSIPSLSNNRSTSQRLPSPSISELLRRVSDSVSSDRPVPRPSRYSSP
jgi:hypothetical protein